jgi:alkylation response protein AidB-like acyl-CoA dehydrogenase
MRFAFSDEQRLFQRTVRDLLARECPPAEVRAAWTAESGRSAARWQKLAEIGVLGLTVPAALGGLGGDALDWVLPFEEAGRAALPEPVVETVAVAAPLLAALDVAPEWLRRVAAGEAMLTVGLDGGLVADAHAADLAILRDGDTLHAVPRAALTLAAHASVDGARRLFRVTWTPSPSTRLADGVEAACAEACDRGALAAAAMLVGLGQRLVEMTVEYVKVRRQFGQAVGAFQAVKHQLADALGGIELARPLVYHAAWSVARARASRAVDVSMAKAAASDAAERAARVALQCHGAIGYSFEHDLHLWMKRAWALGAAWGDAASHRARVAAAILDTDDGGSHE